MRAGRDLPGLPQIRAYLPGRKFAIACVVDGDTKRAATFRRLGHVLPGLNGTVDGPGVAPNHEGDGLALGFEGNRLLLHTNKANTFRKPIKGESYGNRNLAKEQTFTETVGMDVWPQRPRFVALVKAKVKAGTPFAEIATALGMTPATLQGHMEQHSRPPSKKLLTLAPTYFNIPIWELWGRPMSEEEAELVEAHAMMRSIMGYEVAAKVSDADALKHYRFAKTMLKTAISIS